MSAELTERSALVSPRRTLIGTLTVRAGPVPSMTLSKDAVTVWALAIPLQFTVTSFPETLVVVATPPQVAPVNVAACANWKTT
jgi:hypothetical protein